MLDRHYDPIPLQIQSLTRAFGYLEWLQQTAELAKELGTFLTQALPQPDHFVTLTLRDLLHQGRRTPLGFIALGRAWQLFYRHTRQVLKHRFEFIYITEPQARGVPHIHGLTWNTAELKSDGNEVEIEIEDRCWKLFGQSRMSPFDPRQNAGEYCCKYLFRGCTEKRVSVSAALSRHAAKVRNRSVHNAGHGVATT